MLNGIRIPLSAFGGVNTAALRSVTLEFGGRARTGSIQLADVAFQEWYRRFVQDRDRGAKALPAAADEPGMPNRLATAITTWRTYRRGRVDGRLPIVAYPAGAIPAAAAARLEEYATPLRAAGFVHALDCGPRDRRAAIQNHCSVLFHPDEQLRAWVMDLESEHSVHTVVELTTRFADGRAIGTLNTTMPPIFDRPPWLNVEVLPGATVDAMLASHRPRVAAVDAPKAEPWDADPLTTAAHENEAVLAYQAERGLLAEKDGDYDYTGRGAVRTVGRVARAEPDQSSGAA